MRQPWGTRKAPGPTKRALGYKETPLPAPTDVGTAVRVLTSRPAAAGRDGAAPTTVVLSSDAAAVTSKVDSEPNAAVDKQPVSSAICNTLLQFLTGQARAVGTQCSV